MSEELLKQIEELKAQLAKEQEEKTALQNELETSKNETKKLKTKEENKYKAPLTQDFKLSVSPAVEKGTLPMLRFGKKYAIKNSDSIIFIVAKILNKFKKIEKNKFSIH